MFAELTAKKVYDLALKNKVVKNYLPEFPLGRGLNREYLFNVRSIDTSRFLLKVINTIDPEFFAKNVAHAFKMRRKLILKRSIQESKSPLIFSASFRTLIRSLQGMISYYRQLLIIGNKGRVLSMLKQA